MIVRSQLQDTCKQWDDKRYTQATNSLAYSAYMHITNTQNT